MDTLNHFATGYIMTKAFNLPEGINIISGTIGALPDLIGMSEKIYYFVFKKEPWKIASQRWNWYNWAHNKLKWPKWIPQWGIHIWEDNHTHKIGKRWWKWKERMWAEVWSWDLIIIIYIAELLK